MLRSTTDCNLYPEKIPNISARSWIIYDRLNNEIVSGKNYNENLEIASLTKIMTLLVTI